MAFSGTSTFEKFLSIDDIITESFERLGFFDYSGNDLRSARRSLNIMFQEWDNRGLHFWEVARTAITLVSGQNEYTIFRSPSDGDAKRNNYNFIIWYFSERNNYSCGLPQKT